MSTFVLRLLSGFLIALAASQTLAFNISRHQIDWSDALRLSVEQQQQIQAIDKHYLRQQRQLSKQQSNCQHAQQQAQKLEQKMFQELQAVLTAEQLEQANELIARQHKKVQRRHLEKLAATLELSSEQRHQLLVGIDALPNTPQWPMNLEQREQARQAFATLLSQHLTKQQYQQWQDNQQQTRKKWHPFDATRSNCQPATP